jgi:DNA-binding NtrC family response regulator
MTVLINGETGTGKEIAAKQVHNLSARRDKPMVAVNCAAIPDTLIESELFGYEKGAFTGATTNRIGLIEAAHGGTLFLDEIGELPLAAQARLLRFIQEGEIRRIGSVATRRVNVRLICATHRDLATLAKDQEFRQDLYYRINVLQLDIPPLRDRGEDIRSMILWFLEGANQRLPGREKMISEQTLTVMTKYGWPGNVRELEHAIERAVIMAEGSNIEPADLGLASALTHEQRAAEPALRPGSRVQALSASTDAEPESELSLEDYFQRFVLEHQGAMNETELAQKLGISRKCLWERRQRLNLPRRKPTRRKSA